MRSDVKLAGMIGAALLVAILVFTSFSRSDKMS